MVNVKITLNPRPCLFYYDVRPPNTGLPGWPPSSLAVSNLIGLALSLISSGWVSLSSKIIAHDFQDVTAQSRTGTGTTVCGLHSCGPLHQSH